jgi:beta-galactosidase
MNFEFRIIIFFIFVIFSTNLYHTEISNSEAFYLGEKDFFLKGKPFQIISGEMHYPRIPKEAWRDRLRMAKAMGLNTISVYIFWNVHQPEKNEFNFSGNNDISKFIQTAKEEGLFIILRPSPYVCAEWEFGGYPYWLLNENNLIVRSKNENYLKLYRNYIQKIADQIAEFQINRNNDGNILLIQLENEYGFYGDDKEYLIINRDIFINAGFDGVLFTCDPKEAIKNGHLDGLLPAINGEDNPDTIFRLINENNQNKGPYLIAEWYPAWFDSWGKPHNVKPADEYSKKLENVLKYGISINMYMFHGGTSTGFRNGANFNLYNTGYEPQVTSYDYDAPLDEAGNPTEKYYKFREVIRKYLPKDHFLPEVPQPKPAIEINNILFEEEHSILDNLHLFDKFFKNNTLLRNGTNLPTFEDINLDYGYIVYEFLISPSLDKNCLEISGIRDYALIFVNGTKIASYDRRLNNNDLTVYFESNSDLANSINLQILVENLGRINFGPELLNNRKGIMGNVKLNGNLLKDWTVYKLALNKFANLKSRRELILKEYNIIKKSEKNPVILRGYFDLEKVEDSYLNFSLWGKGTVWINGNNLGRYWYIGPQQTLYLPREWLKNAKNEIVIFEMIKTNDLKGIAKPILDKL